MCIIFLRQDFRCRVWGLLYHGKKEKSTSELPSDSKFMRTQRKHRKETWCGKFNSASEATALVSFWSWSFESYLVFFLLRKIRYHLVVNYLYQTEAASVPLARPCSPALRLETDRTLGVPEGQALIWFHAICHSSNTGPAHEGVYHTIVFKINERSTDSDQRNY